MSASFQFPPTSNAKTVTAVTVAVIALHVLVGAGLMFMPSVPLPPVTVTPPLEIEFIQPPEPVTPPTDTTPIVKKQLATPVQPLKPAQTPKPETQPLPTQPTHPTKTVVEKLTLVKTVLPTDSKPPAKAEQPTATEPQPPTVEPVPTEPKQLEPVENQPTPQTEIPPEPTVSNTVAAQPTVKTTPIAPAEPVLADNRKSESAEPFAHMVEPRTKAMETVTPKPTVQPNNDQSSPPQHELGNTQAKQPPQPQGKVEQEKQTRQTVKANVEANRETNNKTDYSGKTRWKNQPNITLNRSLSEIGKRKNITSMTVRVSFSARGNVTDVAIIQSSGDNDIDIYLQRQIMKGTLHPYAPDGVAVAGTFILPIGITYPK